MIDTTRIKHGKLMNGDCLHKLKLIPSDSMDLVVTDPPYGLGYFGMDWDKALPPFEIWKECHRVLKPGAFAFIMSSVRQDVISRMILSLEMAGFETGFTSLYWTYLTGFPHATKTGIAIDKKLGIESKVIDTRIQEKAKSEHLKDLGENGVCIEYAVKEPASDLGIKFKAAYAGFQPKPAVEAILVAMKPLSEKTYVDQAISNGKGVTFLRDTSIPAIDKQGQLQERFISNLIVSEDALDLYNHIECADSKGISYRFSLDAWAKYTLPHLMVSKPTKKEKELGLNELKTDAIVNRKPGQLSYNVPMKLRPSDRKNIHPTVKPLKLMAYLAVLGSRPGDIVLDPFCGSGTTCLASRILGRKFIGIEKKDKYFEIAKERLSNISGTVSKAESVTPKPKAVRKLSDIESVEFRFDNSVIDMKRFCELKDKILDKPEPGTRQLENVEIETVFVDGKSKSPAVTKKKGKGKKEKDNVQDWAGKTINIVKGCTNNCRYCYARELSIRRHGNNYENWTNEQLNEKMINKGWRKSTKKMMFPSTHDITPGTYDACESVLKKLLTAGNQVLIVSKPRVDLIEKLCDALEPYKDQLMFRFTISARNNEILSFWEPNAPSYEDRVDALIIAFANGFRTSVSIEPMLDPADIKGLVEDLRPFTTDSMWLGPVKEIRQRTRIDSEEIKLEVQKIEAGQTPEKLLEVYNLFQDDPLIKWKGHFRILLRKVGVEVPEQNDDWKDRV